MQKDVYVTPSFGDGAGICNSFKAVHSKTALFLDTPQKRNFPAVIINDLLGILG